MAGLGLFRAITRPVVIALTLGGLGGVLFVGALNEFHHFASSNAFCTSCHSMTFAAATYQQSVHYNSASGVRASCGDCHVSPGLLASTWDHAMGVTDLFKQFLGGVDYDDPVINALHLPDSAFVAREWFRKRDSASCRSCHVQEAIQGKRVHTAAIHREEAEGKTCIDCHTNLVHRPVPDEHTFKRDTWNRMIEAEFGLEVGAADRLLANPRRAPSAVAQPGS